jgi:hypothetical protein
MADRSKLIRKQPLEELQRNRREYQSVHPAAPYVARIQKEGERYRNGEITLDAYYRFRDEMLAEHDAGFKALLKRKSVA